MSKRGSAESVTKPAGEQPLSGTLRETVREALLSILEDSDASAAARASAGRTLLEYFDTERTGGSDKRGGELTLAELDAEIESLSSHRLPKA